MSRQTRRQFVHATGLGALALPIPVRRRVSQAPAGSSAGAPPAAADWVPGQDPAMVREFVGVSHANLARVRELVERHPALSNAAVDWGFGDWEDALGAASHMGRRDIAEVLLAHGARPTLFSAAMLGQLDVVKALVAARPGIQRTLGPHGITLLSHAKAGGPDAAGMVTYLQSLGDADRRPATVPLDDASRKAVVGRYTFGPGPRDHFDVDAANDQLGITRPGWTRRGLGHVGALVFFPVGVPSLKIAFAKVGDTITHLTLAEPDVYLTATRV